MNRQRTSFLAISIILLSYLYYPSNSDARPIRDDTFMVFIMDIDHDGRPDIVLVPRRRWIPVANIIIDLNKKLDVIWFRNNPDGTFSNASIWNQNIPTPLPDPIFPLQADFYNDGRTGYFIQSDSPAFESVLLRQIDHGYFDIGLAFFELADIPTHSDSAQFSIEGHANSSLLVAAQIIDLDGVRKPAEEGDLHFYQEDLDGDGIKDLILIQNRRHSVSGDINLDVIKQYVFWFQGQPDGSHTSMGLWSAVLPENMQESGYFISDFSGNGYDDIFFHSQSSAINSALIIFDPQTRDPEITHQFTQIENLEISGNHNVALSPANGGDPAGLLVNDIYQVTVQGQQFSHIQDENIDNGTSGGLSTDEIPPTLVGYSGPLASISSTGQLSYLFDFLLPPGVADFEPSVSLIYNSSAPPGLAGTGWALSAAPIIERCGPAPAYGDNAFGGITLTNDDRLCLNGKRLQLISGSYWQAGAIYKPESNGSVRIVQEGVSGSPYFRVAYPDGRWFRLDYAFKQGQAPTLYWAAGYAEDAFGNGMKYLYADNEEESLLRYIRYGHVSSGNFDTEIEFTYDRAPTYRERFIAGRRFLSSQILSSVRTKTNGQRVADYRLIYELDSGDHGKQTPLLSGIQHCGYLGNGRECTPALELNWTKEQSSFATTQGSPTTSAAKSSTVLDWFGTGSEGFAVSDGQTISFYPFDQGHAQTAVTIATASPGKEIYTLAAIRLGNNEKQSLLYLEASLDNGNLDGQWRVAGHLKQTIPVLTVNHTQAQSLEIIANPLRYPAPVIVDINGNGHQDAVVFNGNAWRILFAKGTHHSTSNPFNLSSNSVSTSTIPASARPFALSIRSDGLATLAYRSASNNLRHTTLRRNGTILGSGNLSFYDTNSALRNVPGSRFIPADINGDGYTDLVIDHQGTLSILLANGDGRFVRRPTTISSSSVFVINHDEYEDVDRSLYYGRSRDMNGNGFDDLVFYNPFPGSTSNPQPLRILFSDGHTLASPQTSGVTAHLRTKQYSFQPQYAEMPGVTLDYQNGTFTVSGESTPRDIETEMLTLLTGELRYWQLRDQSCQQYGFACPPIPYPSAWPNAMQNDMTMWNVASISNFCGRVWLFPEEEAACQHLRGTSAAWPYPAFDMLEGYHFYLTGQSSVNLPANMHDLQVLDVVGNGVPDIVTINADDDGWLVYTGQARRPRVSSIVDTLGRGQEITYAHLAPGVYSGSTAALPEDARILPGGLEVVARLARDSGLRDEHGDPITIEALYTYGGSALDIKGRGFLGFQSIGIHEPQTSRNLSRIFSQDYPHIGFVKQETLDEGGTVTETYHEVDTILLHGGIIEQPLVVRTAEARIESGQPVSAAVRTWNWSTFEHQFVQLDQEQTRVGRTYDAASQVLGDQATSHIRVYNAYVNKPDDWVMGFATEITDTWSRSGDTRTRNTTRVPHSNTLREASRTDYVGTPYQLETAHIYSSAGNIQSTTRTTQVNGTPQSRTDSVAGGFVANRYPRRLQNALGHTESNDRQYNLGTGALLSSTDPNGLITSYRYDAIGRLVDVTRPGGVQSSQTLHACDHSQCTAIGQEAAFYIAEAVIRSGTAGYGMPTTYRYKDMLGREIAIETTAFDGSHTLIRRHHNLRGDLASESVPHAAGTTAAETTYQYRPDGRLIAIHLPSGESHAYSYQVGTQGGLITSVTSTGVRQDASVYTRSEVTVTDVIGEAQEIRDDSTGLDVIVEYAYDAQGNRRYTRVDQREDLVTIMEHDLAGRMVKINAPDTGETSYQYNGFGELEGQTLANGHSQTFVRDTLGRLTARTDEANSVQTVRSWAYDLDAGTHCNPDTSKRLGTLACAMAPGFQEDYSYDALGRLEATDTTISVAGQPPRSYHFAHTYDDFGRPEATEWPNGYRGEWTYTMEGYLRDVEGPDSRILYEVLTHDRYGSITEARLAGGALTTTSLFDPDTGRLTSRATIGAAGVIQQDSYNWWSNGNLGQRTQMTSGVPLAETFTYDGLNRLTEAVSSGAVTRTENVTYDRIGNITTRYGVSGIFTYSTAQPHAVTSAGGVTYGYDAAGNMVSRGGDTITYNALNNVERVATSGIESSRFHYGPNDARFYQRNVGVGIVTETFYVRGLYEDVVTNGVDAEQRVYVGDFLLHTTQGSNSDERYLLRDHLGSVSVIADEQGNMLERTLYAPWGGFRMASGTDGGSGLATTPRGFTNHEHLTDLGLIHMNGRVYDPVIGRFLSADPFVQAPESSQSYNRYSYLWNNPLNTTDPSGFCVANLPCPELVTHSLQTLHVGLAGYSDYLNKNPYQGGNIVDIYFHSGLGAGLKYGPASGNIDVITANLDLRTRELFGVQGVGADIGVGAVGFTLFEWQREGRPRSAGKDALFDENFSLTAAEPYFSIQKPGVNRGRKFPDYQDMAPTLGHKNHINQDIKMGFGGYFLIGGSADVNFSNWWLSIQNHANAALHGWMAALNHPESGMINIPDSDLHNWHIGL